MKPSDLRNAIHRKALQSIKLGTAFMLGHQPAAWALLSESAAAPEHGAPPASAPSGDRGSTPAPDTLFTDLPKNWQKKCPKDERRDIQLPCPRRPQAPRLNGTAFEPLSAEVPKEWNYAGYRYSVVMLISSWNERSTELAHVIKRFLPRFRLRQVGVLGIASHDAAAELRSWQRSNAVTFPLGLATLPFTSALENPKVPTVWIANGRGDLVSAQEIPTREEFISLMENILVWTDF